MVTMFLRVGGLWGLAPLLIGAICLFAASQISGDAARLASEGVTAQARIVERRTESRKRPNVDQAAQPLSQSQQVYDQPVLTVTFTDQDGTAHRVKRDISGAMFTATEGVTVIPVVYVPGDPSIIALEAGDKEKQGMIALAAGLIFLGMGLFMMAARWRRAGRMRALGLSGTAASATVERVRKTWPFSQLDYRFKDAKGKWRGGRSLRRFPAAHRTIEAQDFVTVFYDPANPKRSVWKNDLRLSD